MMWMEDVILKHEQINLPVVVIRSTVRVQRVNVKLERARVRAGQGVTDVVEPTWLVSALTPRRAGRKEKEKARKAKGKVKLFEVIVYCETEVSPAIIVLYLITP